MVFQWNILVLARYMYTCKSEVFESKINWISSECEIIYPMYVPIQYWVGVKVCATTKSGPKRKENWICYFSLFLLRKKIFVLQAFFDINDKTYSISVGAVQLIPTPINIFSLDNFAIWINTMFEAKINHFLCFFYAPNDRTSNRNSANL